MKGKTKTISNPTRTGYTFAGWTVSGTGSSINGTTFTMGTADTTLTAKWTANTYTVAYNGNGSTGGSTTSSSHIYDVDKALTANGFERKYTVTYNHNYTGSTNASKTATYTFKNWNTAVNGTGTSYTDKASVKNLTTGTGTVNLYAQWNTGSASYTPVRTGYIFDGWFTDAACSGTRVDANGTYTPTNNTTTLYAKWTPITYTVIYNGNGSTGGSTASSSHIYDTDKALTVNGFERKYTVIYNHNYTGSTNTSKTATYTFNGWATSENGSKVYNNQQSIKNLTTTNNGTLNLYANWSANSVSYTPTRTGYVFGGWYKDETCTNAATTAEDTSFTPEENTTLYAKWIPISYTIEYNGNGNTSGSTASSSHTYDVPKALTTNGFKKEYVITYDYNYEGSINLEKTVSYTFNGWSDSEAGEKLYDNGASVTNILDTEGTSKTLYALWTPKSDTNIPTREGYIFLGWYSDKECTNKVTDGKYIPTENTTFYAKWKKDINIDEEITIDITNRWVDNSIQALRRPTQIKLIVTEYKEIAEDAITVSEETISDGNTDNNETPTIEENKVEETQNEQEEQINMEENIDETNKEDDEELDTPEENTQESEVEEAKALENAYSNELQNSSIMAESISSKLDINSENTEINEQQDDTQIVEEENVDIEQEVKENNSEQQINETEKTEENTQEPIVTENNEVEENNENVTPINTDDLEGEKVEISYYEYIVDVERIESSQITPISLPRYDKETEEEIVYKVTVKEIAENDLLFYEPTEAFVTQTADEDGNVKYSAEIVNTFRLPENNTQNITAIKAWNDNGKVAIRPTNLIVELIGRVKNIELVENDVTDEDNLLQEYKNISSNEGTISSSSNWNKIFTSLPIYDENGQEIEYTLQEKAGQDVLNKYIPEVSEISETNEIVITNNLIIQDSKIIKGGDEEINAVDSKVSYNLGYDIELDNRYKENAIIEIVDTLPYQIDEEKSNLKGGIYNYNEEINIATITWRGTYNTVEKAITWENSTEEDILVEQLENIDTNIQYISIIVDFDVTYKDVQISTEKIINKISGTITLANNVSETVENSFETDAKWVKDVVVNKLWKGDTEETRPDSITVELVSSNKNETTNPEGTVNSELENGTEQVTEPIQTTVEITPTNEEGKTEWTHTWSELPTYDSEEKEIKYTVDETAINYKKGEQAVENEYYCEKTEEVTNGKTIVTLTNIKYGSITVEKVDSRKEETKLSGAEFKLEKMIQTEEGEWIVPEETREDYLVYTGTTGEDGTYTFEGLKYGHYKLTETQAPENYKISEKDIDVIEINEENADVQVQIENIRFYKLPITGGIGVDTITNLEVLVGIMVLILITNRKKVVPTRRSKVEARKIKNLERLAKMHKNK